MRGDSYTGDINTLSLSGHYRSTPKMTTKSLNRFAVLINLSEKEKRTREELAKNFLAYLRNIPFKARIQEIVSILYETEIKRFVTLDNRLSQQEKKCLLLAKKGKSIKTTATILKLKYETVRECRAAAIKKLGAPNITAAVALGIKYNLIETG